MLFVRESMGKGKEKGKKKRKKEKKRVFVCLFVCFSFVMVSESSVKEEKHKIPSIDNTYHFPFGSSHTDCLMIY